MSFWSSACCCTCGWGSSAQNAPVGFTQTDFAGNPVWTASPRLQMEGGNGSLWRASINPPNPSGPNDRTWSAGGVTLQATIWNDLNAAQSGIFIGSARVLYIDWAQNQIFQMPCDAHGNSAGAPVQVPGTPYNGMVISLDVEIDQTGTFEIACTATQQDGPSTYVIDDGVQLPELATGATFNAGFCGMQAAQFSNWTLVCKGGGCGCVDPPETFILTISGVVSDGFCCGPGINGSWELPFTGIYIAGGYGGGEDILTCGWGAGFDLPPFNSGYGDVEYSAYFTVGVYRWNYGYIVSASFNTGAYYGLSRPTCEIFPTFYLVGVGTLDPPGPLPLCGPGPFTLTPEIGGTRSSCFPGTVTVTAGSS
jgi:hypothetical protein